MKLKHRAADHVYFLALSCPFLFIPTCSGLYLASVSVNKLYDYTKRILDMHKFEQYYN